MLKKWFFPQKESGKIYKYEELEEQNSIKTINNSWGIKKLYSYGIAHSSTIELCRGILWLKRLWCTSQFNKWIDSFKPECVFFEFSNHIFFQQVALYIAERFNIPIVVFMGDDFYFNSRFSLSPSYWIYSFFLKRNTRRILLRNGTHASYSTNSLKQKYSDFFHLSGDVVYTNSTVQRRAFKQINTKNPLIVFLGSIRLGRNNSLLDIADALGAIDPNYKLEVFSEEKDKSFYRKLQKHPNIIYGNYIPYSEVQKKISQCDIFVIVEGFRKKDISYTRCSLSTKTADALASGSSILAYGPQDAGVIDYLIETKSAQVCTDKRKLKDDIMQLLFDKEMQQKLYDNSMVTYNHHHLVECTTQKFSTIVENAVNSWRLA